MGDFFDLWNPNYETAVNDGSGISYPLYAVIPGGAMYGTVKKELFCPELVMRRPESYSLSARKKNPPEESKENKTGEKR